MLLGALVACSASDKKAAEGVPSSPNARRGGVIDSAFAIGGIEVGGASPNEAVNAMVATKTDATVAVGSSVIGDRTGFLLMRVRGDGTLDPSFGKDGRVVTPIGPAAEAWAAVMMPDGKITVAGSAASAQGDADLALTRYLADGSLDATFGREGVALHKVSSGPDTAFALAIDSASRLVVGGQCGRANPQENSRGTACVARFGANGDIDISFGRTARACCPSEMVSSRCGESPSILAGGSCPPDTAPTTPPRTS